MEVSLTRFRTIDESVVSESTGPLVFSLDIASALFRLEVSDCSGIASSRFELEADASGSLPQYCVNSWEIRPLV